MMACPKCVVSQPVLDLRHLRIGDHIEYGRYSCVKSILNGLGWFPFADQKHLRFGYLYFHHAIVTDIDYVKERITVVEFSSDEITLADFLRTFSKAVIRETHIHFHDKFDHLYRVFHNNIGNSSPSPGEIVKNAHFMPRIAPQKRYNVLRFNCEHLVNWCVTSKTVSIHVEKAIEGSVKILYVLENLPKFRNTLYRFLKRHLLKFLQTFENMLGRLPFKKLLPAFCFVKKYLLIYLGSIVAIAMTFIVKDVYDFYKEAKQGDICKKCVEKWLFKLVFKILSMLPAWIFWLLFAIALSFSGFLAYKSIKSENYTELQNLESVLPGDVITCNLYLPFHIHEVVVTNRQKLFKAGKIQSLKTSQIDVWNSNSYDELLSALNDFFRNSTQEEYSTSDYLRGIMQLDATEEGKKDSHTALYLPEENIRVADSRTFTCERGTTNHQWRLANSSKEVGSEIPTIVFLIDDENIKLYHDLSEEYQIDFVHYDLEKGLRFPDVFFESARVVMTGTKVLSFKLGSKDIVYKRDFSTLSNAYLNSPNVVAQTAINKLGERKWTFVSHWSSDMANECKLVNPETYYGRGYRFCRPLHSHCFNLLCGELSGIGTLEYILRILVCSKEKESK